LETPVADTPLALCIHLMKLCVQFIDPGGVTLVENL